MAYVFLDAGHGGYDTGAEYDGRLEKDDDLDLTLAAGEMLKFNGVDIGYTRTSDVFDSSARRVQMANEKKADLFIIIHRDIGRLPNTESGVKAFVHEAGSLSGELADMLISGLVKAGYDNLGVREEADVPELNLASMPAVMLVLGFIDSDKDNELLDCRFNDTSYAIADAVYRFLYDKDIMLNTSEDMLYPVDFMTSS